MTKNTKTKFFILAASRSGSNWLTDLLNSNPQIRAFEEVFNNEPLEEHLNNSGLNLLPPVRFYDFRKNNNKLKRPWITFKYIDLLNSFPNQNFKAVGFKLIYGQLIHQLEILLKVIKDKYKIIHLTRRNYLDTIISREMSRKRKIWHSEKEVKPIKIHFDTKLLLKKIKKEKRQIKEINFLLNFIPLPVLDVYYEELCKNTNTILNSISNFLNVSDSVISYKSRFIKLNKGYHWDKIMNYDEVKKVLLGTKFINLLDIRE